MIRYQLPTTWTYMIHVLVFPDHIVVDTWGTLLDHKNPARDAILRIKLPGGIPPLERARSLVMICLMSAKMSSTFDCNVVDPFVRRRNDTVNCPHFFGNCWKKGSAGPSHQGHPTHWNNHPPKTGGWWKSNSRDGRATVEISKFSPAP